MTTADPGGVKIFLLNHGQVKHITSVCNNNSLSCCLGCVGNT